MAATVPPRDVQRIYFELLNLVLPRYIRISSGDNSTDVCGETLGINAVLVKWLPSFVSCPGTMQLLQLFPQMTNHTLMLNRGYFPMDIASSLPVLALELESKSKILDLCCCPGSKYLMMADTLDSNLRASTQSDQKCLLVGVDISDTRMNTCKSLLMKWKQSFQADNTRLLLFSCDGTEFGESSTTGSLVFDSNFHASHNKSSNDTTTEKDKPARKRMNKSARGREKKFLRATLSEVANGASGPMSLQGFDGVLVDAECSHDGSYRHMRYVDTSTSLWDHDKTPVSKEQQEMAAGAPMSINAHDKSEGEDERQGERGVESEEEGEEEKNAEREGVGAGSGSVLPPLKRQACELFRSDTRSRDVQALQRGLVANGFRRLRPGGHLVYSTCSLEEAQDEAVVRWLLDEFPDSAELVPIEFCRPIAPVDPAVNLSPSRAIDTIGTVHGGDFSVDVDPAAAAGGGGGGGGGGSVDGSEGDGEKIACGKDCKDFSLGPEVLLLEPAEFVAAVRPLSRAALDALALRVCEHFAGLDAPPCEPGLLPGTVRLNKRVGMSGLFLAKIRKREMPTKGEGGRKCQLNTSCSSAI